MLSSLRKVSPTRWAVFLLLAVTGFRLWYAVQLGLVPDEAYYWLWSKHLAASYRDKGPAIAWTIALGTKMFGDTVFGIRFFAVVLSSGTGWLLFVLARRLYDERVALWCLLVALVMPIMAVGSILMTIDSLSVFFWALAVIWFWRALENSRTSDWFWLGLIIGAGFLAKFTNGVQLICIGVFLLWSKAHRSLLWSRKPIVMTVAFLLASLPILWWNVQTGWVHAIALHSRSGVQHSFQIHPQQLLRFVGEQFGVISPLLMAGMTIAAVGRLLRRHQDFRVRFLLSQFLPLYGLFLFFSLNKAGQPNWIAPALVTGIILTVVFWREAVQRRPGWRWGIAAAFALATLMTGLMHNTDYLRLPAGKDPLLRTKGWPDFAAHVQRAREQHHASLLLADHYSRASLMAFYLSDRPPTYLLPAPYGASQFTLWPGYQLQTGTRALFVIPFSARGKPLPKILAEQFDSVELVDDFWSLHQGRPMSRFLIYLCRRS